MKEKKICPKIIEYSSLQEIELHSLPLKCGLDLVTHI